MARVSQSQAAPGIEPFMNTTTCATSFAVVVGLVCVPGSFDASDNVAALPINTHT